MYPSIRRLVPHGSGIRGVETLLEWEPGKARCRMTVRPENPFVRGGELASITMLEYLAQAVAACLGHEAYTGGEGVRVGMLIGVRKMDLHRASVPVGTAIDLHVTRIRGSDDVSTFEGRAVAGGEPLATALMTLFHAPQMAAP